MSSTSASAPDKRYATLAAIPWYRLTSSSYARPSPCRACSTSSPSSSGRPSTKANCFSALHTPHEPEPFRIRSADVTDVRIDSRIGRFGVYGALGWCLEVLFTGMHDYIRNRDPALPSRSSVWMFPIYGLLQP